MSEDKNDFLKPVANGRMVNSWKAFIFPACDHTMEAFTLAFYIYNIYYIMYIFFKKIILGSCISCGLFDTSSPSRISILKKKKTYFSRVRRSLSTNEWNLDIVLLKLKAAFYEFVAIRCGIWAILVENGFCRKLTTQLFKLAGSYDDTSSERKTNLFVSILFHERRTFVLLQLLFL